MDSIFSWLVSLRLVERPGALVFMRLHRSIATKGCFWSMVFLFCGDLTDKLFIIFIDSWFFCFFQIFSNVIIYRIGLVASQFGCWLFRFRLEIFQCTPNQEGIPGAFYGWRVDTQNTTVHIWCANITVYVDQLYPTSKYSAYPARVGHRSSYSLQLHHLKALNWI